MTDREFGAPVRICLAGEDLDWLGSYHCCCVPISLHTTVSFCGTGMPYRGEYLFAAWAVLGERLGRSLGEPPQVWVSSNSPTSSGLASSSSLTVALIRACCAHIGAVIDDPLAIADIGYHAEFRLTHGGGMDQLTIAMEAPSYMLGRTLAAPELLGVARWPRDIAIVVIDPRRPKHTGPHIDNVRAQVSRGDASLLSYINVTEACAISCWEALTGRRTDQLYKAVNRAHGAMRDLQRMSTDDIELVREIALDAGCSAAKLTGAGGGGCVFGLVDAANTNEVIMRLRRGLNERLDGCQVLAVAPIENFPGLV